MYNAFFEFEENPFSPKPDPAFFYRSPQHDTSLRSLMFAVQARMGFSSLAGEEGTGKTLLLECLRDTLESTQIQCAFLRESRISTNRFFQTIAAELDLKCQGTSAYQVFSALHQFTLQQARKGRTVALIVDDAHNLPADVLNEILHLASLHDDKVKLLQTVLAGRPELHSTLDSLNLERLKQHAILSCNLDPFTTQETQNYIDFRLEKAGLSEQTIFPPDAIAEIHLRSRGFAPAIHAICEGLLLAAFSAGSKVCTQEILDQVFRKPRTDEPQVVAVARIELAHLAALSEPEPALLTRLLRLAFGAIKILPPPLPVNVAELLEPRRVALRMMFPKRHFALQVGEFAKGSKKPMQLTGGATTAASIVRIAPADIHAIPSAIAVSRPVSKLAVRAGLRPESKLQRIQYNTAMLMSSASAAPATPIEFPSVALQPANSIQSLEAATALLTLKGVNKLAWLLYKVQADSGSVGQVQIQGSAFHVPSSLGPIQPAAKLQPAGTVHQPRVPVPPFGLAESNPPSLRTNGDFQNHLVSLQKPVGPSTETALAGFFETNVPERDRLFSLACNVSPSAPPVQTPIKKFVKPVESLQPLGPVSKLRPINPRSSWLLLQPSWKPAATNPVAVQDAAVETGKTFSFRPRLLLTLAAPLVAGIVMYVFSPGMLPAAETLNQRWQRAHQAVADRAAVVLREDFRTGLDNWTNRAGAHPSWTSDASGFVHPGALAVYRPSLGMADYQMQFVGTIDKKSLSWVVRAADFNNYYAVRLNVLKSGPLPTIGVTRYAVINGKTQNPVTLPLLMSARSDTVYHVSLDVSGDRFALTVQDQLVDSWSEPKLPHGGIGFFAEQDAASRVAGVQVWGQYDMLGRLCALLTPSSGASYRASLTDRVPLTD